MIRKWKALLKDPNLSPADREAYELLIKLNRKESPEEIASRNEKRKRDFEEFQKEYLENKKRKEAEIQIEIKSKREIFLKENTSIINIIWDDIYFQKNKICFTANRLKKKLNPVHCKGVLDSLNQIKQEYFNRLFSDKSYKLTFLKGDLLLDHSPAWNKILETIEFAKEFYEFKYLMFTKRRIKHFNHLTNEEIINLFSDSFSKSQYLKYLALKQDREFRIIPEFLNNRFEESFLFRVYTKNKSILIVWENVNYSRATHIFSTQSELHIHELESIEEFICRDDIGTKRSMLYKTDIDAENIKLILNYIKSIRHVNLEEYKSDLEMVILQN